MKVSEKTREFILTAGNQRNRKLSTADIGRFGKMTHSHAAKICKELEDNKIIIREKQGRRKCISLTSDGRKVYHCLRILKELGLK